MSKYKKCVSCRNKTIYPITIVDDEGYTICTICECCLRIGMKTEYGMQRLSDLIRRENNKCQNQKLQNRNHTHE